MANAIVATKKMQGVKNLYVEWDNEKKYSNTFILQVVLSTYEKRSTEFCLNAAK